MKIFGTSFGLSVEEEGTNILITGIRTHDFKRFIKKYYNSGMFLDKITKRTWANSMLIDRFFLPEIVFLLEKGMEEHFLSQYRVEKILKLVYKNTWMRDTIVDTPTQVDLGVLNHMNKKFVPTETQMEFVKDTYWQKKTQYHLNGYLLAMSMGLGKTFTSLFLGEALHKKHFVIISPLTAVQTTWVPEIENVFLNKKNIWSPIQDPSKINKNTDCVVVNYDGLSKVIPYILKEFKGEDTIVIIDEFHNFKDIKSLRTETLVNFVSAFKCTDVLPMSGTPIKALGIETIPIFRVLDPWCTPRIVDKLKEMMRYTKIMNDLLRNRIGAMMYRKTKEEVLDLPPKHESDILVKIANGDRYTLDNVKKLVVEFTSERRAFYKENYKKYMETYEKCLHVFEKTLKTKLEQNEYKTYLKYVALIQKHGSGWDMIEFIKHTNIYEKNVILPALPANMRASFRDSKSVVKYVELKILGEVLGGLLNQLRTEMSADMIGKEVIDIILNADKKTILFSSYREAITIAESVCKKNGLKPLVITGDNTNEAKAILEVFKNDDETNPLIASTKTMSTAHTILIANTVIFLNVPFRSVDYDQASDRVYRIGQDTDVYIYRLLLDTGNQPNLSTRMHDIIAWSKEQFNTIIVGVTDDDTGITGTEDALNGIMDRAYPDSLQEYDNFLSKMFNNIKDKLKIN